MRLPTLFEMSADLDSIITSDRLPSSNGFPTFAGTNGVPSSSPNSSDYNTATYTATADAGRFHQYWMVVGTTAYNNGDEWGLGYSRCVLP
jgi:hypothetical protein